MVKTLKMKRLFNHFRFPILNLFISRPLLANPFSICKRKTDSSL